MERGRQKRVRRQPALEQRGLGWWRGGGFAPSSPATNRHLGNPGHPHRYPSGSAIKVIAWPAGFISTFLSRGYGGNYKAGLEVWILCRGGVGRGGGWWGVGGGKYRFLLRSFREISQTWQGSGEWGGGAIWM